MEEFRKNLAEAIKEKRPKITESSIKTYVSILFNLVKKMEGNQDVDWYSKNVKEILEFLKEEPANKRKTILSALFVVTGDDEYRKLMIEDCKVVNTSYKSQKMTVQQSENWISTEQIRAVYDDLLAKTNQMLKAKTLYHYGTIIEYLLTGLLGAGVSGLTPRRSMDYSEMKIKNFDTTVDNYYKAGIFYFNKYKTQAKYGLQQLNVKEQAPELNSIIKKWIKINQTDYLLFSSNNNKLSSPQITRILNKVFGKSISCDMLRHIYLTSKYGHMPTILNMQQTSSDMGNSISTMMEYIKHE